MGFFSNLFKRITSAQKSMGDNMIRLGKETGHLDLTRDAAEEAYKAAKSVREMDNLTSATENKISSHFQKVKVGRNSYAVKMDYSMKQQNGATEADLDFLKPKEKPIELTEEQKKIADSATINRGTFGQMQSMTKNIRPEQVRTGLRYEDVVNTKSGPFHEDEYGNINVDMQGIIMQSAPGQVKEQLSNFYSMYKANGAILTSDGKFVKADDSEIHTVSVEAISTGLKPVNLEEMAEKVELTAAEVQRSTDQIIMDANKQGAYAVHPKQTEAEIRMLAQKVTEISKEIEQQMEALQVKDELKREIFGWIKEAADQKNRYICAEIKNAIIFISNQLDTDKINDPSIKNPSVIIAGLDDRGVPEKLIQFNTIEDCRRELGSVGERFTDMSMLRELSHASREFERIAQLTNSEHIEDVVYRLEKSMRDYVSSFIRNRLRL